MRPKKHYVAAEIKAEGFVFDSDQYNCKLADSALLENSGFQDLNLSDMNFSSGSKSNQVTPNSQKYGALDDTLNCSPENQGITPE